MENHQQNVEREDDSTELSEKSQDADGGHQLEEKQQDHGEEDDQTATTDGNSAEDKEDSEGDPDVDKTADVSREVSAKSALTKKEERLKRLRELHLRRNEARKLNHAEVIEEDRRNKLPANWEARKRKLDWEIQEEDARKQAEEAGEDYERIKLLETPASDIEKRERKKKKKNPDTGFAGFAEAQHRQYERLTRQMEPDLETYERQKQEMGADFFPGVNTLLHGTSKVSQASVERMAADLEKQIEKRAKYSRRRPFDSEGDVDYINERNMKFNKKASRYYDQYTAEIKQNLERGTAV